MARRSDAAKLLAIGLLNYADDEGYFYADGALIRSALRPFDDDSTIVRRCLAELSCIGYCDIVEHPTHGLIGRVVAFAAHQRVDRPKPSAIKDLFDSTTIRRTFDDESTLEGKGREQGMEGNRECVSPPLSGEGAQESLLSPDFGLEPEKPKIKLPDEIEQVWKAYPAKGRARSTKEQCLEEWRKLKPRPPVADALAGLEAWKKSDQWHDKGGQYIPGAHLWIKRRAWESKPEERREIDIGGREPTRIEDIGPCEEIPDPW